MTVRPSRTAVAVFALACAAAAAGSFATASAEDDSRSFDGWTVLFEGVEDRYPEGDGWTGVALRDGYSLTRSSETVTYHGNLLVERTRKVAPNLARGPKEDEGDGWSVRQCGEERYYSRQEGWVGRGNADGWYLERRGQTVWYYGNFRVVERPRDDSDLRQR
jgi:hypothetical protein